MTLRLPWEAYPYYYRDFKFAEGNERCLVKTSVFFYL